MIWLEIDKDEEFFKLHRSHTALAHTPMFAFKKKGQWYRCFIKEAVVYLSKVDYNTMPKNATVLVKPPYSKD